MSSLNKRCPLAITTYRKPISKFQLPHGCGGLLHKVSAKRSLAMRMTREKQYELWLTRLMGSPRLSEVKAIVAMAPVHSDGKVYLANLFWNPTLHECTREIPDHICPEFFTWIWATTHRFRVVQEKERLEIEKEKALRTPYGIKAAIKAAYDKGYKAGYEKGYGEGRMNGYHEGYSKGKAESSGLSLRMVL